MSENRESASPGHEKGQHMDLLDRDACYRVLQTRDARFDGRLFVGVTSTGIYCRPICPARTPHFVNCRFFASAAAAQEEGFRPCLRCRPETAPRRSSSCRRSGICFRSRDDPGRARVGDEVSGRRVEG